MQQLKGEVVPLQTNQTMLTSIYSYLFETKKVDPIPASTGDKVIIFDLDGVVLTTNSLQAFQEIGIDTTLLYIGAELLYNYQFKIPSKEGLFKALELTPADSTFDSYHDGLRMPQIMVDQQIGAQSLIAIQLAMNRQIKNSNRLDAEKNLLLQTVAMMTTPEKFIRTRTTIPAGVELLHELKAQGYKIYVLSNWDPTSFPLLKTKFPEIFTYQNNDMFDGIMISGNVGMLKPEHAIFKKCLTDFNIKASSAIFIDDTIENVQAAQNMGITAIQCDPHNIPAARKQLIEILKN